MQFLFEFLKKFVKNFSVRGKSYATYIKRVLSCDFQITLKKGNIDGGGGEDNFSLTILKENCLVLQLPINFSHTIDTRIKKHACTVLLIVTTHLNFFPTFHVDIIQISVISVSQKCNLSVNYKVNCLNLLE